jgi:hypothetical protein
MTARAFLLRLAFVGSAGFAAQAADRDPEPATPVPVSGPTIELPPMIVAETSGANAWLYVRVRDDEYLSRCSAATTLAFIESREELLQGLRAIVPDAFLSDLPSITLLSDQALNPKADDQVAREILRAGKVSSATSDRAVRFLPSLGLDGRDVSALFTYLDERTLRDAKLVLTNGYLRFRLERRTPMLPPWLIEGILAVHSQIVREEISPTLHPLIWLSPAESRSLARNPLRPRALLPAGEMFAPDALRDEGNQHPRRVQTLQAQVELFFRWALDPRNRVRAAFWKFAARASEQRVTEELFFQSFGFGFSDLRDRLSDYLPIAVKEPLELEREPERRISIPQPKSASRRDILRIRGEWERLEIAHVQHSHPEFAGQYVEQARRTLKRAYDEGDRDPRLLADLGLCEVDAGDAATGMPFLEQAIASGETGPRTYYEVARFRFAGLLRDQPADRFFSAAEVAAVLEPLRQAIGKRPLLPEIFGLWADVAARCREPAPSGDIEALLLGARSFPMNPAVSYRIALALAHAGRRAEAAELLANASDYVTDEAERPRFDQLQSALQRGRPATP